MPNEDPELQLRADVTRVNTQRHFRSKQRATSQFRMREYLHLPHSPFVASIVLSRSGLSHSTPNQALAEQENPNQKLEQGEAPFFCNQIQFATETYHTDTTGEERSL